MYREPLLRLDLPALLSGLSHLQMHDFSPANWFLHCHDLKLFPCLSTVAS